MLVLLLLLLHIEPILFLMEDVYLMHMSCIESSLVFLNGAYIITRGYHVLMLYHYFGYPKRREFLCTNVKAMHLYCLS